MKKLLNTLAICGLLAGSVACTDQMETAPTDSVSGNTLYATVEGGMVALNGIYRATYLSGWSESNTHQNFGNMSTALFADLEGDDMVQNESGNGWFYFDYNHTARTRYTSKSWRSYATWNYYYTLISNANYILAHENDEGMSGDTASKDYLFGQAYAIRSLSYFYLIQLFQQTYVGHENAPGVPVYTEPTEAKTEGKPRGTVEEVYTQINSDIDKAIELLERSGKKQEMPSHIDSYAAYGIKARIALVQNKWDVALDAAQKALSKSGLKLAGAAELSNGMNSTSISSVMWGASIQIADQSTAYASFFSHMDATVSSMYGAKSRKCISTYLYKQMSNNDFRLKAWWNGKLEADEKTGPNMSYCQKKFSFSEPSSYLGDYIYMRAEEMYLIEAEAMCRLGKYSEARKVMSDFGTIRDADYAKRLASVNDAATLTLDENGTGTAPEIKTLLDEIILQRRIELWGEYGRIFDILRLKTGMYRRFEGSNHTVMLTTDTKQPDWKAFILTIPQAEFDGNTNMNSSTDQNPV